MRATPACCGCHRSSPAHPVACFGLHQSLLLVKAHEAGCLLLSHPTPPLQVLSPLPLTTPSDFNLEMLPSIFESHSLSDSLVLQNCLSFHVLKSDFLNSGRHLWRILCARVSAGAAMLDGADPPCGLHQGSPWLSTREGSAHARGRVKKRVY